jgi:hypothetical protein
VLRKLLWFREGGEVSEKQWRDVVSVLRISGDTMDDASTQPPGSGSIKAYQHI